MRRASQPSTTLLAASRTFKTKGSRALVSPTPTVVSTGGAVLEA
jgi:hypothetical protein